MLKKSQCHFIVDTARGSTDGAYCGKPTKYKVVDDGESPTKVRQYEPFCPEHTKWVDEHCCPNCGNHKEYCECDKQVITKDSPECIKLSTAKMCFTCTNADNCIHDAAKVFSKLVMNDLGIK